MLSERCSFYLTTKHWKEKINKYIYTRHVYSTDSFPYVDVNTVYFVTNKLLANFFRRSVEEGFRLASNVPEQKTNLVHVTHGVGGVTNASVYKNLVVSVLESVIIIIFFRIK